jgi:branched-chain amino acid transport system substrate-binding protein
MTRPARPAVAIALTLAAALCGVAGCGGSGTPAGDRIDGTTLTIYSSEPLQGASAAEGQAIVNGERLALSQFHNRIGRYRIMLRSLDDATVARGGWDPGQTTLNARLAAANPHTIGFIGELDSGASAISIPILNRAGIPQVSAASTAVGLTSTAPGASPGEPGKYYPSGVRTFVRVIPNDTVQAVAQVRLQQGLGCSKTFVLDDGQVDGSVAATTFQLMAASLHLQVVGVQAFDPRAADYSALAGSVAQTGADCVLISAATQNHAVLLTEQVAAALPEALLFGWAGLAEPAYVDPAQGGIPTSLDGRLALTAPALAPQDYPAAGQGFFASYERRFGQPQPEAIFGYEAMSLMLSALVRATRHGTRRADRARVLSALFATRHRASVLGTYSIDRNGDTTLRRFGAYQVSGGRLRFLRAIAA